MFEELQTDGQQNKLVESSRGSAADWPVDVADWWTCEDGPDCTGAGCWCWVRADSSPDRCRLCSSFWCWSTRSNFISSACSIYITGSPHVRQLTHSSSYQILLKSKKLFADGRTDGWTFYTHFIDQIMNELNAAQWWTETESEICRRDGRLVLKKIAPFDKGHTSSY